MAALTNLKSIDKALVKASLVGWHDARVLAVASTAENAPVPANAKLCIITVFNAAGGFAKGDGTAVVPAGDVADGTASVGLAPNIPFAFDVEGIANISLISTGTNVLVTLDFYKGIDI